MRLYSTDSGLAREDDPGMLSLLALDYFDIGDLLRDADLDAARHADSRSKVPIGGIPLRAPIAEPGKIVIAGLNYASHADEARQWLAAMGTELPAGLPSEPTYEVLPRTPVASPGAPIALPHDAPDMVDYESEIVAVMGRVADHVDVDEAWTCIAGLTIANDVTARDVQRRLLEGDAGAVGVSKSFDTFKPLGPCLVSIDEFAQPIDLRIQARVNGEQRQDDRSGNMLFGFAELVSFISQHEVLHPGDVVLTGNPAGSGMFSGRFLGDGDVVEIEVQQIGILRNVVAG